MKSTHFRTILVLWLFLCGLVSLSDPTDLARLADTAVIEYTQGVDVGETKLKDFSANVLASTLSMLLSVDMVLPIPLAQTFHHSPSSLDRYQLLSTYRI